MVCPKPGFMVPLILIMSTVMVIVMLTTDPAEESPSNAAGTERMSFNMQHIQKRGGYQSVSAVPECDFVDCSKPVKDAKGKGPLIEKEDGFCIGRDFDREWASCRLISFYVRKFVFPKLQSSKCHAACATETAYYEEQVRLLNEICVTEEAEPCITFYSEQVSVSSSSTQPQSNSDNLCDGPSCGEGESTTDQFADELCDATRSLLNPVEHSEPAIKAHLRWILKKFVEGAALSKMCQDFKGIFQNEPQAKKPERPIKQCVCTLRVEPPRVLKGVAPWTGIGLKPSKEGSKMFPMCRVPSCADCFESEEKMKSGSCWPEAIADRWSFDSWQFFDVAIEVHDLDCPAKRIKCECLLELPSAVRKHECLKANASDPREPDDEETSSGHSYSRDEAKYAPEWARLGYTPDQPFY